MASNSCRSSLLGFCKLFERLFSAGRVTSSFSSCRNNHILQSSSQYTAACSTVQQLCGRLDSLQLSSSSVQVVTVRGTKWYADKRISGNIGAVGVAKVDPDLPELEDKTEGQELVQKINDSLKQNEQGRLFAVVRIGGAQRRVTAEDIIVVESYSFPPTVGDRIRLEKVLLVGGRDFTLIGQPLLSRDQVKVEATVIEKTLTHNRVWSTYRRRKRYRKFKVFRVPQTMLVINSIELNPLPESGQH